MPVGKPGDGRKAAAHRRHRPAQRRQQQAAPPLQPRDGVLADAGLARDAALGKPAGLAQLAQGRLPGDQSCRPFLDPASLLGVEPGNHVPDVQTHHDSSSSASRARCRFRPSPSEPARPAVHFVAGRTPHRAHVGLRHQTRPVAGHTMPRNGLPPGVLPAAFPRTAIRRAGNEDRSRPSCGSVQWEGLTCPPACRQGTGNPWLRWQCSSGGAGLTVQRSRAARPGEDGDKSGQDERPV